MQGIIEVLRAIASVVGLIALTEFMVIVSIGLFYILREFFKYGGI